MNEASKTQPSASVTQDGTVAIIGAGIAGLVLALELHHVGVPSVVYEAAPELRPLGVGINILPHASIVLQELGLEEALSEVAVLTEESVFYNRFGQFVHREPTGRSAGYPAPQYSIHRGALQQVLVEAVQDRLGADALRTGYTCTGVTQNDDYAEAHFAAGPDGAPRDPVRAPIVVACDGVHSVVRKQFYPGEGQPRYSGVMMWRGTTVAPPYLSGATMVRVGWLTSGKMVVYPIQNDVDGKGNQLINWVAELETPQLSQRDWINEGSSDDFASVFADWKFDWLDFPAMIADADVILQYPMVDQDPLPRWTYGRITLLGDAAHPMVPRGSNGAGQAILDARALAELLGAGVEWSEALARYEADRLPATSAVVLANRQVPPDSILREVWERTQDQPFDRIEDVITEEEIADISSNYKSIAGLALENLRRD